MMNQKYTQTACICILVSNDIHYMHFLASGEDFDKSHMLAEQYYSKLEDEADYLMELALEHNETIVNYSTAIGYLDKEYIPEDQSSYDYNQLVVAIINRLNIYLTALQELRNNTDETDIQSYLDDTIRTWRKELDYKLQRRLENESEENEETIIINE